MCQAPHYTSLSGPSATGEKTQESEGMWVTQGPMTGKHQSWDLNPGHLIIKGTQFHESEAGI